MTEEITYKTIGQVAKDLNLIDKKRGKLQTHTIRFWEKQFKQVKPTLRSGNRRYYDKKSFDKLKLIKFLLKDQGLTIKGVKKLLEKNKNNLDVNTYLGLSSQKLNKEIIKNRLINISKKIKKIKLEI